MKQHSITTRSLEAAFIDQKVAGAFRDKRYAFVAVYGVDGWQLGVAVANEDGYSPIDGKHFEEQGEAAQWAAELNSHIGLTVGDTAHIIVSTMRGYRL
jgi:hypothetical protein